MPNSFQIDLPRLQFKLLIILLFCLLWIPAYSQTAQEQTTALEFNKPFTSKIKTGEIHTYSVALEVNQFLQIDVEQRGIDVLAVLNAPNGDKLNEIDDALGIFDSEQLNLIAASAGVYKLTVIGKKTSPASQGEYEIEIKQLHIATEQEKNWAAAEQLINMAQKLAQEQKSDSYQKAIDKYAAAIEIYRNNQNKLGEAIADDGIAFMSYFLGNFEQAIEYYNRKLAIVRDLKKRSDIGSSLNSIGYFYFLLGDKQRALDYYSQALSTQQSIGNTKGEYYVSNNLGLLYQSIGEWQKSLDYFNQVQNLMLKLGDEKNKPTLLNNVGIVYLDLGEKDKALDCFNQALEINRANNDKAGIAAVLVNIGDDYDEQGDKTKALENLLQALSLWREIGNEALEANTSNKLGKVYLSIGNQQQALVYYNQALNFGRKTNSTVVVASALKGLGEVYSNANQFQPAIDAYQQALSLFRNTKNKYSEALALFNLAGLYAKTRQLAKALENIEAAIEITELLRSKLVNPNLKSSYIANVKPYYELYINVLMQSQNGISSPDMQAHALEISERVHARSLLELLAESRADIEQNVDLKLLEREHHIRQLIAGKAERQTKVLSGQHTDDQAATIAKEVTDLTDQYDQIETEIRQKSPRYAALVQPEPVTLKTIQTELLDKDTVLLEYSLGEKNSYLWIVSQSTIETFELPGQQLIEAQARKVYELLTARNETKREETSEQKGARLRDSETQLQVESANLSQIILAPVADKIKNKRLLIVADGALQYIPFAALPISDSNLRISNSETKGKNHFLVETNEIVNLPSASVLSELRRDAAGRTQMAKTLAVFADPVFSETDMRLKAAATIQENNSPVANPQNAVAVRSIDNSSAAISASKIIDTTPALRTEMMRSLDETNVSNNSQNIPRLPFSRREANNILSLAPTNQTLAALDFKANLATVENPALANYRIIHFATHGLLNSVHPELSGIILSLVDESGKQQNGFLRLNDIYNLKLPADLVVLSACQTALGKDIKGEGLIGLTRGFMYAGASRVVASLWKVDDAATAELMQLFYQKMLKENLPPAAALRAAQIELSKQKRWSSPYFWAAFTIQGEWK